LKTVVKDGETPGPLGLEEAPHFTETTDLAVRPAPRRAVFSTDRQIASEEVRLAAVGEQELHPQDAADMRERHLQGEGELRAQISAELVGLFKRHHGKGPVRCSTYLEPNLVIVVLGEGYTAAEQTLFEAGKWHEVRRARQQWQDTMRVRFVEAIEQLTHRKVSAFMSANHQDPDLSVELFVLEGEQDE
jgi:uncharacterized protein YbcI